MSWLSWFTDLIDGRSEDLDDRYKLGRGQVSHLGFGRGADVIGRGLGPVRGGVVRALGGSRTGMPGGGS